MNAKLSHNPEEVKQSIKDKQAIIKKLDENISGMQQFTSSTQLLIWRRSRKELFREVKKLKIHYDLIRK